MSNERLQTLRPSHVVIFELPKDVNRFITLAALAGRGAQRGAAFFFLHEHPAYVHFCAGLLRRWEAAGLPAPHALANFIAAPREMPPPEVLQSFVSMLFPPEHTGACLFFSRF